MIEILVHHTLYICFPIHGEVSGVVVVVFGTGPNVRQFIDHQHTEAITGVQHGLAHRMVRASNAVEPGLLELFTAPLLGTFKRCGSEKAVIVVNACSAQVYCFSVDSKSFAGRERQRADPQRAAVFIQHSLSLFQLYLAAVQIGRLAAPEPGAGNIDPLADLHALSAEYGHRRRLRSRGISLFVQKLRFDGEPMPLCGQILHRDHHGDHRAFRIGFRCGEPRAPFRDVKKLSKQKIHVPIDPAAGIPAAVALVAVVNDHADPVDLAVFEEIICLNVEIRVAVGIASGIVAVDIHGGIGVYPFKFNDNELIPPLLGCCEYLFVGVDPARVKACMMTVFRVLCPLLVDHGVMRKAYLQPVTSL